jgi:hypothetical protein
MAPTDHDSDSNAEASPTRSKSHGSPEQHGQSDQDQDGPEDSGDEEEVYEIEAILDAKRGATGSVRFSGTSFEAKSRLISFPRQE